MTYTESNIEDWDFGGGKCVVGSENYDPEADMFLSGNYTTVVAVDTVRLSLIDLLVERGAAALEDDRQHVRLSVGDDFLAGMKSAESRFSRDGRFARNVIESLRRENRKYGRLRLSVLPPTDGA